jgi:bifunctional polynucleotide phosphatase/kinase
VFLRRPQSGNSSQPPPVGSKKTALNYVLLNISLGKAVANFFTPLSKKEPEKMTWRIVQDSLLVGKYVAAAATARTTATGRTRVAAFDFVRLHAKLCELLRPSVF